MTTKRLGFFTRLLDKTSAGERYRLATLQIQHAEHWGYDTAWIAQHHFHENEGGLPSPLLFLASVAAQTSRIRLGTAIITLPMENALRVAEDAAVLDLLSQQRLELGLGSGGTHTSFLPVGLTFDERAAAFNTGLNTLLQAWGGDALGHDDNRLYPAAPQLAERIWQATFSVAGAARAGAAGHGLMLSRTQPRPVGTPLLPLDEIQNPMIDAYLAALPAGTIPRILASRTAFVSRDGAEARRLALPGLTAQAMQHRAAGHVVPGNTLDDYIAAFDVHLGTPQQVVTSLQRDTALARVTDVSFQVHSIDPPHEQILTSIELLATDVAPALGWRAPVTAFSHKETV